MQVIAQKPGKDDEGTTATSASVSLEHPALDSNCARQEAQAKDLRPSPILHETNELNCATPDANNEAINEQSMDTPANEPSKPNLPLAIPASEAESLAAPIKQKSTVIVNSETADDLSTPFETYTQPFETKELTITTSFLPSPVEMDTLSPNPSLSQPSPSTAVVEHETETWLKDQLNCHHMRQPSIIDEERDFSDDDGDRDHHHRLAKAAEKSQLPIPAGIKSWNNMQTLLQEAEMSEQAQKLETSKSSPPRKMKKENSNEVFVPQYRSTYLYERLSKWLLRQHYTPFTTSTWIGFWALSHVTCANHVLTPMRDAIALQIGVAHVPKLTLVSMLLAFCSSVPIGWLFEAPDPSRRRLLKKMGLTRGETQGTSLALFYRTFALMLLSYAAIFEIMHLFSSSSEKYNNQLSSWIAMVLESLPQSVLNTMALAMYVAFFLMVHLMKLHSISLMWGVTTEAMEYEEIAQRKTVVEQTKTRIQRMALVSFGGTVGGILGR